MKDFDLRTLTANTAFKVTKYIAKLEKSRKVRKEISDEDIKRYNELHGLIWALSEVTSAIDSLISAGCSEELLNDSRRLAVSMCERIDELIKK